MTGPNAQGNSERGAILELRGKSLIWGELLRKFWPISRTTQLFLTFFIIVLFCSPAYSYVTLCDYLMNSCTHCHSKLLSICLVHHLVPECLANSSYSINIIWVSEWTSEWNDIWMYKKPLSLKNSTHLYRLCVSLKPLGISIIENEYVYVFVYICLYIYYIYNIYYIWGGSKCL